LLYPYINISLRYLLEANNIPIKRKICKIGTGSALFLPKIWLDQIEEKHGTVKAVTIEVNDALTIKPIIQENTT
jgi:antitoxin component of MazEF toxin-antitoxin module